MVPSGIKVVTRTGADVGKIDMKVKRYAFNLEVSKNSTESTPPRRNIVNETLGTGENNTNSKQVVEMAINSGSSRTKLNTSQISNGIPDSGCTSPSKQMNVKISIKQNKSLVGFD
jgi:hypothetical protein